MTKENKTAREANSNKRSPRIPKVVFPAVESNRNVIAFIGFTDHPEIEGGQALFPANSLNNTIAIREQAYSIVLQKTKLNFTGTINFPETELRESWLRDELKHIDQFSKSDGATLAAKSVLNQYKKYVNGELINKKSKRLKVARDTLEKACFSVKAFKDCRAWFIKEDLCDSETFHWKREWSKRGIILKTSKSMLVNYLKDLHVKNYTPRMLTEDEVIQISWNSFAVSVCRKTISNAKGNPPHCPQLPSYNQG